jgi:pantoate--beta-alanine ligase
MKVFRHISQIREVRLQNDNCSWGLVPTMGFLHEGHLSLVRRAKSENDRTGVSIFVNPTQFGANEDLSSYPRDLEKDLALLEKEGVDLVWTPEPDDVYPPGYRTYVTVDELTDGLEGASRPGHFRGVCTVVTKIYNVFQPHRAYFGQKDAQQAAVISKMTKDLDFNIEVIVCPTVREPDGLAMSSRNSYLSPDQRKVASTIYKSLSAAKELYDNGERNAETLKNIVKEIISGESSLRLDYISTAVYDSLEEREHLNGKTLMSIASYLGKVRLIDNIIIG